MLLSAAAIYGVAHSSVFTYASAKVEGVTYTDEAAVLAVLEDARGTNLFGLVTRPLEERIRELPTVRSADVSVRLPDIVGVRLRERSPILVWQVGARRYLVDVDGQLFARLDDAPPEAAADLPIVEDRRAASVGLAVGRAVDRVDLDAATRLASLVPADVGSEAEALHVYVSDANGFTIRTKPSTWQAVFGFYTPTLARPNSSRARSACCAVCSSGASR